MKSLFLTRRNSAYFMNRVSSVMSSAGFDISVNFYSGDIDLSDKMVFADYYRITNLPMTGVLMPCNENPLGVNWLIREGMDDAFGYFICSDPSIEKKLKSLGTVPSCFVPFPFVLLPDFRHEDTDLSRPIKFFLPCYGNWTMERCKQFLPALIKSVHKDTGSLDLCEFIVDTRPFAHTCQYGEKVTFVDIAGKYLWSLMHAKVVTCLGSPYIMEAAFLDSLARSGQIETLVYAENIMTNDTQENVDRTIDRFSRSDDTYSENRKWMVINEMIKEFGPSHSSLCNFASMLFGHSGVPVFSCDFGKMMTLFRQPKKINTDIIQIHQSRGQFDIVERLSKIRAQLNA